MAKRKVNFGDMLAPLVGGGTATGASLILRGFVPPYPEGYTGEDPHWAFKYAGLLGGVAGIGASIALGFFRGWGEAATGSVVAALAAANAQLYNTVVPEEAQQYRGYMVARPSAYGQPAMYGRTRRRGLRGVMIGQNVDKSLPENVSSFPTESVASVNMKAFGGGSF